MAVFTDVSSDALSALLEVYDIGQATSLKGIAEGVQNSNFLLETERGKYILTLYEQMVDKHDVPFFLDLMQHLSSRGISCPLPVQRRDGTLLSMVANRPAAIVTFLNGTSIRTPRPEHCEQAGAALAQLHLAGANFKMQRENDLGHNYWQKLYERNADQADQVMPDMAREISAELKRLASQWPDNLPRGVIHADLFPDNVFFVNNQLSGLIDFYFACNDYLAYDLAICLNAWCFEADLTFNLTKARNMITAYQKTRPLSTEEAEALPLLCAGAAMRFLLTRLHDWLNRVEGALVTPKDPVQYLRRLRFHKTANSLADYGVDV